MRSLVEQLPPGFEFSILTRDRDHTATEPYPGVPTDWWVPVGRASVRYLAPADENPRAIARLAREAAPDVVLANSVFSRLTIRYLVARRLGLAPRLPLVVAPRGEFSPGALGIRGGRKKLFILLARRSASTRAYCGRRVPRSSGRRSWRPSPAWTPAPSRSPWTREPSPPREL